MLELAKNQLKWVDASKELFLKVRQLVANQKQHLYKYDELEMCTARLSLYGSSNYNPMRDNLYLNSHEVCTTRRCR
jgi:hypothetical protein